MSRIILSLVMRNEAYRYLRPMLEWTSSFVDDIFIVDDHSTDISPAIAELYGVVVPSRVSFAENEGVFREEAFRSLEETMQPSAFDWILSLDADEFLVSTTARSQREELNALSERELAVDFSFQEVFDVSNRSRHLVRTDGAWGSIRGIRFFPYRPNYVYKHSVLASGSAPINVGKTQQGEALTILHYGYAALSDREMRYDRYKGTQGHGTSHIESILQRPKLHRWPGITPDLEEVRR